MRAYEIALYMVMVAAGFTIVASMGIFPPGTVPDPTPMFNSYTVDSLSNFPTNPSPIDYFFLMVILIVDSIKWAFAILTSIIIFYPYLMVTLNIPAYLAIPLEAGIWFIFVIAVVQIWRAFSVDVMR